MIYKRTKTETIKMSELFQKLEIVENENETKTIVFPLYVKTPYGFYKIVTAFRTEKQPVVTTYFKNNETLKTSEDHLLKVNGEWKKVKDISDNDVIETQTGTTSIVRKHNGKEEILYDISVEDVHCYYSNGIVSHNSWVLAKLGSEAIKQGKNVLHVTLELNENYVGLRYDSCFTGIDFQNIKNNVEIVKKKLEEIKSKGAKLVVKYYPIKTVSANSLKLHAERIQMLGTKIDMMIVDYADILRPSQSDKNSNSYSEAGGIYEELRAVAGEMQIPIWSASQANRCLSLQTIVDEEVRGKIEIGNLVVGDKVLTHGGYKKVSYIYPEKKQPVYKIKLKSGKILECSGNHRFPTLYGKLQSIETGLSVGDKLFTKK